MIIVYYYYYYYYYYNYYSRETIKSSVFGFGISAPTMTLEQFAEKELMEAKEREIKSQQMESNVHNTSRRFIIIITIIIIIIIIDIIIIEIDMTN